MSGGSQWQREVDAMKPGKKGKAERSVGFAGCSCGATELCGYEDGAGLVVRCGKCGRGAVLDAMAVADEVL